VFSSLFLTSPHSDVPAASTTGRFCVIFPQVLIHTHTDTILKEISIRQNHLSFCWTLELLVIASTYRTAPFLSAVLQSMYYFPSLSSFETPRNLVRDATFTLPYINKSIWYAVFGTLHKRNVK
jgi:hypothetical protein